MHLFSTMMDHEHEQIAFWYDKAVGLKSIIAIHDTTLGPALGGVRMWPYDNEEEAITDVLRLAKGMSYKNAAAGLNLGGGKAVIIGDPSIKSEALYRSFGRFIASLGGRYITAEDVNTTSADILMIREETHHVSGLPESVGGGGDPSPFTALGTLEGIKVSLQTRLGMNKVKGKTIAVQGLGSVGAALCELLYKEGASLIVTDIVPERVRRMVRLFKAKPVEAEAIYSAECDVFSPCALGGILNDHTIPQLQCSVIAGAANNQLLEEDQHGLLLKQKNILYAPDYIINAGGVINCYYEVIHEYVRDSVLAKVKNIPGTLQAIYQIAEKEQVTTSAAAARFAQQRIEVIGKIHRTYLA